MTTEESEEIRRLGAQLMAAHAEEASLSVRSCQNPDSELLFCEWAQARQRLEECQNAYSLCLDRLGFPDLKIRAVIEL